MDLTRTALTVAIAFCTAATVYGQSTSTQADVNAIANYLELKVILRTNHFLFGNHSAQFYLRNVGNLTILNKSDWIIRFQMKNKLFHDVMRHSQYSLEVLPEAGCHYILKPDATAATPFGGLAFNETVAFTVPARGLSVFRTDVYSKFIVYATTSGITARTIKSTLSPTMDFVFIDSGNVSRTDPSLMGAFRRSITSADVFDHRGVPISTIIPVPKNITVGDGRRPPPIMQLNASDVWYIWAGNGVSDTFQTRLRDSLRALPDMAQRVTIFQATKLITQPPANKSLISVIKSDMPGRTKDFYELSIGNNGTIDYIHITAGAKEGFANALSSLMGITGVFNSIPHLSIGDDARFGHRSIELDLTKNFFPKETILKLLRLMSMYKMNNLVMHMADNNAWRLEMPASMDFSELTTFASQRCLDETQCLRPIYGSGADTTTSGSGFYSMADFKEIISEAYTLMIRITPKINFMGSLASAIDASHKRYERLKTTNQTEADRLHLMSMNYPTITAAEKSVETCYTHGVLDPCNPATRNFTNDVITAIMNMYSIMNVPLYEFHAGGDETTEYMHKFPNCTDPLRKMLKGIRGVLRPYEFLRVSEEAVFDPATENCYAAAQGYNPSDIIVDFKKIFATDHRTWNMTQAHIDYLMSNVTEPVNDVGTDPVKPTNFAMLGDAPWSLPYKCANMDYKVILAPEPFYSLDSASELDFNEMGNRKRDRFFIINFQRVIMFDPFDIYAGMDVTADRYRVVPYRLAKIFNSVALQADKRQNIIGLAATIDTSVISSEDALWHSMLPRALPFADAAWRKRLFEGVLDQTDTNTLINMTLVRYHATAMEMELNRLSNTYGYKDIGRLGALNYTYRVDRPGASIYFALPFRNPGPYPVIVKSPTPGVDVQYREVYGTDQSWRTLFHRDRRTNIMHGGMNISFPFNQNQPRAIDIRILSDDFTRSSIPSRLEFNTHNLYPREVPSDLRGQTCLPIREPWRTPLENITLAQWNRILSNIPVVLRDETLFSRNRFANLAAFFRQHRRTFPQGSRYHTVPSGITFDNVIDQIDLFLSSNVDLMIRQSPDLFKDLFVRDRGILQAREQQLATRLDEMHQQYVQACLAASAGTSG